MYGYFSAQVIPKVLFNMAVEILKSEETVEPAISVKEASPENNPEEAVSQIQIPINFEALAAIQTLQMYAMGRGDADVLGNTVDFSTPPHDIGLYWYTENGADGPENHLWSIGSNLPCDPFIFSNNASRQHFFATPDSSRTSLKLFPDLYAVIITALFVRSRFYTFVTWMGGQNH